jgi:EAL domain-containing protein (putative c-di-GMP-specific phosphodiesterase class I)
LLPTIGHRIRQCIRPQDTVARLGGDEFAILLRKAAPHTIDTIAEQILASLAVPVLANGHKLLVQASIGIAVAAPDDDTHALLRNADIAMYAAKEHGKGGYARFTPGMAADILEHAQLGAELRHALDHGHLRVLYQPIVQLIDQRIVCVEALVRWQHPVRGLISPVAFIHAAERTGLIVPLGRWVLREACRQSAAWRSEHGDAAPQRVGVNVSVRQLQEPGFADEITEALADADLQPSALIVEVTESAVLTGGRVLATLDAVRRLGVRVALDDFGTGQSSLGLIRTCPVDILKLDRSFVDGVTGCKRMAAVAAAVVQLAQSLGVYAVAEGIESQEQADYLWSLGYRLGQGFYFMPPLAGDRLSGLLSQKATHR